MAAGNDDLAPLGTVTICYIMKLEPTKADQYYVLKQNNMMQLLLRR